MGRRIQFKVEKPSMTPARIPVQTHSDFHWIGAEWVIGIVRRIPGGIHGPVSWRQVKIITVDHELIFAAVFVLN